ncbi:uncharacterized protein I303_100152 [Kwoniella dejecticola CBS 10117]|uniref:Uncharacterized protein n=1 Tax=Kwoniella dejecticola CBS 10117 TaxID=1296121 RepID=A0AAJ8KHG3_9TREE
MQQGPRMAMPANPHLQHPGMNQPMDPAVLQQQVAAMNAAAANGNVGDYGGQQMTDQNRAYIEQQLRMQQQHQQQQQGREGKVAAQRALGVGAQPQNPQQMYQQQQLIMQQQGIRQITTANGQVYVDSQGRQVTIPPQWQQVNDPRQPPAGMVNQAQLQAFYQAQQAQAQAQQQQPQPHQQHVQQHHPQQQQQQQQQQMLPPQQALHYQRQQQLAQQQALQQQQQQQQQQRGSQPPSARPPNAVPPQIAPGQSPALLQVPPPPMKRAVSRAGSRSASPIPPHIRPPSAMAQPMQASTSAMPTTGAAPTILPHRSATVPVTNGEGSQIQFAEVGALPRTAAGSAKPTESKFARLQSNHVSRPQKMSSAARLQRYEEKTVRLQRMIDKAQAALIVAEKEAEEAKKVKDKAKADENPQIGFDCALLNYNEDAKSATVSPNKNGSSEKSKNPQAEPSAGSKSSPKGEATPTDSIFGPEKGQTPSPSKMAVDRVKEESSPQGKSGVDGQSPAQAAVSSGERSASGGDRDLGDLYTWWVVFQDSKRILAKRRSTSSSWPDTAAPMTGKTPSSAVAARIAMANPAAAVRAASVDFVGQRGQAQLGSSQYQIPEESIPVTATLQQMEALKREQTAKIQAEQEANRRRMEMQNGMQDGGQLMYQNGQTQAMTPEQIQSMYQQQQQLHAQQHHLQPQATGTQQQQMYQQLPVTTPGGTVRHMPQQMMMQQNGLGGSPSHDSPMAHKRGAEASPIETHSTKKAKMVGKQPTPEDHRRQAIEMAKAAMPAPGILQLPGQQQRSMSQEMPRPSLEAQRQYSQTQAAYARQQEMAVRQHIANSPAQMTGMSPAQMTPAQMTEQSPVGMGSPSTQNAGLDVGMNGLPNATPIQQQTPTSGGRGKKGKATGLTVDTDTAAEAPEATPTGASGKGRKASANKKLPKSAASAGPATATEKATKGKNAKGSGKGGRPSTADAATAQIEESPSDPTQNQLYGVAQTPNNPTSGGDMSYGTGSTSAPGSSRSQVFALPPVAEIPSGPPPAQQMENGEMPQQAMLQAQPMQPVPQQQPGQEQPQQHQQQQQQPAFDGNFGFDDTADFLKSFDFGGAGMQMPNSADYGSFNFDEFNFTNLGENQDDWTSLDGGMS